MMNNFEWLIENAQIPIKYNLSKQGNLEDDLFKNIEIKYWISFLQEYYELDLVTKIHGSHDYRVENILGKLWLLGMNSKIERFDILVQFYIKFLNTQIGKTREKELSFGKIYSYYDFELVLASFLSLLGYSDEPCIEFISQKRVDYLYEFTKEKRYDIYVDGSKYTGVKKDWQPYLINPELYKDGNISIPCVHDFILLSSLNSKLNEKNKVKIDSIVSWIFSDKYSDMKSGYGYFYAQGKSYNVKSIIRKFDLPNIENVMIEKTDINSLILKTYILSNFATAQTSKWFKSSITFLSSFMNDNGRYLFEKDMLSEKRDTYFTSGGHMNVGEDKSNKKYYEILSTYWMYRIKCNLLPAL